MAPTEDRPVAREVTVRPETDSPLATALLDEIRSLDAGRPGPSVLHLAIESYAKERMGELVGRSLAVFVRVAEDLKQGPAGPPYGLDAAFAQVKDYVGDVDLGPPAED